MDRPMRQPLQSKRATRRKVSAAGAAVRQSSAAKSRAAKVEARSGSSTMRVGHAFLPARSAIVPRAVQWAER